MEAGLPKLESLTIQGFKSFGEAQTITFAQPDGTPGSGLTLIVGPNKSGKSTLFQTFQMLLIPTLGRESSNDEPFEVTFTDTNGATKQLVHSGGSVTLEGDAYITANFVEKIPARRYWAPRYSEAHEYLGYAQSRPAWGEEQATIDNEFARVLAWIYSDADRKARFDAQMKRIVVDFTDWEPIHEYGESYIEYKTGSGKAHRVNDSGEGLISAFRLVASLIEADSNKDKVLIIDEPELSLHPAAQEALSRLIAEASSNKQIVLATHSPHFINFDDLARGAKLVRLNKIGDRETTVHVIELTSAHAKNLLDHRKKWRWPFALDAVAKEIFFVNDVLFLEGQEDVGLIRNFVYGETIPINFALYGYGVGGIGNLRHFLLLGQDLGLRMAALVDKGFDQLSSIRGSFPDCLFVELEAEDIRDKHAQRIVEGRCREDTAAPFVVEGYFSVDGEIKDEYREKLRGHIEELNAHFAALQSRSP
jgi:predicted ATPase